MPPPQPTAQEQAAARDWEAKQEFEREQRRADAQAEKERIAKEAKDAAWRSGKNSAYNSAITGGSARLNTLGIGAGDKYGVYNNFINKINAANTGLETGADYTSAFSDTVLDNILAEGRTGQRNKLTTEFNTALPQYYGEDTFSSTRDDAILQSILDTQYGDALADLTSARDRGQATSAVYDRSLRDLETGKATANTELQGIGRGVLEDIIGDIGSRRTASLGQIADWDYGSTYDPNAEAGRIRSYADERGMQLEGDIRGAVGGKEFFDINSLLGKAKARIGSASSPGPDAGSAALADTFANEATRNNANIKQNEGIF